MARNCALACGSLERHLEALWRASDAIRWEPPVSGFALEYGPIAVNERLDVLILHGIRDLARERRTSIRHLFALQRYAPNHRFVYHYVEDPISDALRTIPFGAIVLDSTFLGSRWFRPRQAFMEIRERYDGWLREYGAIVAAFPQDDFDHSTYLDEWLAELGTNVLFSVYRQHWDILYPRLIAKGTTIVASLAGYIDEDDLAEYRALRQPFRNRAIDVGYRVRRLPANFGRFGIMKSDFGRAFLHCAANRARCDISDEPKDSLYGELWPRFLGGCRFVLGTEAGSSVLDPIGEVKDRVLAFVLQYPAASFEEISRACIRPEDEGWKFPAISPRIFEAAMAGNCPILIEGDYDGLIAPEHHFIAVKPDFSNIESAIDRLSDRDGAEAMALRFQDVILDNSALRYKTWIRTIVEPALLERAKKQRASLSDWEFAFRLEQHRSAMVRAKAEEIDVLKEQMRVRLNEMDAERLHLVNEILHRPLWKVIGSRLLSKLPSR
jgi:hypothetical protein